MRHKLLREAIRRALRTRAGIVQAPASVTSITALAALGLLAAPAFAQDAPQDAEANNQRLETITVTGSNIRRVDIETANPVITIDRTQIQKTGKLNVGDLLQDLPSIAGNGDNPRVNNGGGGTATLSLRGLGSQRTLVLVNGHRLTGPAPDVTQIPTNIIERIEVLGDGASAVYGSDAIAGVVNFILRADYQGAEFSTDYGISDHDDGERKGYNFTLGHTTDKGSLVAGVHYEKLGSVPASNREFSAHAQYLRYGAVVVGGSARNPQGRADLPDDLAAQFGCGQVTLNAGAAAGRTTLDDYHCYTNADSFNFQSIGNFDQLAQERSSVFVVGNYKITDNITAYLEAFHSKSSSNTQGAPLPFDAAVDGVHISADNYYNPFGIGFGPGDDELEYLSRFNVLGTRRNALEYTNDQVNTGFKGNFGESSWQWSANYSFGHFHNFIERQGYVYYNGLQDALGPSFWDPTANGGAGAVVCGTPGAVITGCTPINIFNTSDPATAAALASVAANPMLNLFYIQREADVQANGELFDLPAGPVNLAVGASHRKEYTRFSVDFIAVATGLGGTCFISQEVCTSPSVGDFTVKELYAETLIPILKDVPFVHSLNLTLGDRYSKYSSVGNTTNWKAALEWRPIEDLLLRGTVSKVFRAPTLAELYAGATGSAPGFTDPCIGQTTANPACAGVPLDGSFQGDGLGQTTGVTTGAVPAGVKLKPEFGKSFDLGIVYDPSWLDGLSMSADLWRIYLNDLIIGITAQTIANLCYNSTVANPSPYCAFLHRREGGSLSGNLLYVNQPTVNLGRLDTKGVDFAFHYRLPETRFGNFRLNFQSTYVAQYDNDQNAGAGPPAVIGVAGHYSKQFGNVSRWRALSGIDWNLGPFDAHLSAKYIGPITVGWADGTGPSGDQFAPNVELHYGSNTYFNLSGGYNIEAINTRVDLGVDNLTDRQPPILYQNNVLNANTDANTYDLVGRFYWARVTVKF